MAREKENLAVLTVQNDSLLSTTKKLRKFTMTSLVLAPVIDGRSF